MQATIFDLKPFSIHDGPGIRTTVFFKGCPLSCAWCHNPEGISASVQLAWHEERCMGCGDCLQACPTQALSKCSSIIRRDLTICRLHGTCAAVCPTTAWEKIGRQLTVAELLEAALKDRAFFEESGGGVTCSGGEPLMQAAFLQEFFTAAKAQGLHLALDTSGFVEERDLLDILPLTDLFLFDLKLMDAGLHQDYTGVSNALILQNLKRLDQADAQVVIRFPLIPTVNDSDENLEQMITFLLEQTHFRRIDVLPYHPTAQAKYERLQLPYRLNQIQPGEPADIQRIAGAFHKAGFQVKIGG
jgi:pyruvate formate lyase activating enzyme